LLATLFIARSAIPTVTSMGNARVISTTDPGGAKRMLKGTIMTKSAFIVAIALAAAGAAYADGPTIDTAAAVAAAPTKTRAEVKAELAKSLRAASTGLWSESYNPLTMTRPAKTRNRVLDELELARDSGHLRAFSGEDSGSAYMAARSTRRSAPAGVIAGTLPVTQ
jgi:hypothetical protein